MMLNRICCSLLVSLAFFMVLPNSPTFACLVNEAFQPGKPFDEAYFKDADIIFRGHPVGYRYLHPESPYANENYSEVTFEVVETYLGDSKERWTGRWTTIAFQKPKDLDAFKREIGDDLVVVLRRPQASLTDATILPAISQHPCAQPAMRSYAVMEPVLRARGLIE
jgi:hypothetical protein